MKILITAGGTAEKIDDVRVISNNATGRLGCAIADAFLNADNLFIEKIFYICANNTVVPLSDKIDIIRIGTVNELVEQIESILSSEQIAVVIHSMAVSDYSVSSLTTKSNVANTISTSLLQKGTKDYPSLELVSKIVDIALSRTYTLQSDNKISSEIDDLIIVMKKTPKVIGMIKVLQPETILVGFKLLSNVSLETLIATGYSLLQKNSCDLVLANDLNQISDNKHVGYLISSDKSLRRMETKTQIAEAIVASVTGLHKQKNSKEKSK